MPIVDFPRGPMATPEAYTDYWHDSARYWHAKEAT